MGLSDAAIVRRPLYLWASVVASWIRATATIAAAVMHAALTSGRMRFLRFVLTPPFELPGGSRWGTREPCRWSSPLPNRISFRPYS